MEIEKVSGEKQIGIIENLANEIWNEHFVPIIGKAQVDYMLEKFQSKNAISEQIDDGYMYFLISDNKNSIGYMAVLPEQDQLFLSKLYISSAERNKGYGRQAIAFLEKLSIEKALNKISLTVNRNNSATIKMYQKCGFKKIREAVQDIGNGFVMDDYIMEKPL